MLYPLEGTDWESSGRESRWIAGRLEWGPQRRWPAGCTFHTAPCRHRTDAGPAANPEIRIGHFHGLTEVVVVSQLESAHDDLWRFSFFVFLGYTLWQGGGIACDFIRLGHTGSARLRGWVKDPRPCKSFAWKNRRIGTKVHILYLFNAEASSIYGRQPQSKLIMTHIE